MSASTVSAGERSRLITGVVLSVAIVGVIFFLDSVWTGLIFAFVGALAAWEWNNLLVAHRSLFLGTVALLPTLWFFQFFDIAPAVNLDFFLYAAIVWWAGMFLLISAYNSAWRGAIWLHRYFSVGRGLGAAGSLGGGYRFKRRWFVLSFVSGIRVRYCSLLYRAALGREKADTAIEPR